MRFWLTVAVFAVLNLGAWFAYHQWLAPRPDLVQVEAFTPGEGGVLMTWGVREEASATTASPAGGFGAPSANPFAAPPSGFGSPSAFPPIPSGYPGGSGFGAPSGNPFASGSSTSDRLIFRFNLPMETDGDLNRQPPGRIMPALAGVWRWEDPRQLVFVPSAAPLATGFSVTLDPQVVRARGGFRLARAFTATFQTPALQVTEAGVMQADPDGVYQLRVAFSDVVLADEVRAAVRVVEADGTPVAIQHWSVIGREARLITESLSSRAQARNGPVPIRIVVKAGLTGRSGPLGLAVERTFPLVLDSALRLERVSTSMTAGKRSGAGGGNDGDDQGHGIIHLAFNRAVQFSAVRQVLSVEPAVDFIPSGDGTSMVSLIGAFRPGQRYAVVIAAPPPGAAGTFPLPERMPAWMPEHAPHAWFPAGSGRLGSQGTRTLALKAVNLRATTLRAWRLYDNNLLAWAARGDARQPWQVATLGRPLLERRLTIGEEKNRFHDLRVDLERELPADARGDGVVLVEVDEQHSDRLVDPQQSGWSRYGYYGGYYGGGPSQAVVSLSDLALSCRRGVDGCTVWVTSLSSAQPVADVRVRVFSSKLQLLGTAVTGPDGLARVSEVALSKAAIAGGETASVVIADTPTGGLSWLALSPGDALRDPFADTGGELDRAAGLSAFIHAERGVWRPGETAHLRAIVRDGAGQAPAVVPLRWRFRRPDARIWREEVATTLPSGDLLLDVPLPTDLPTGAWQAELTLPGDERVLGQVAMQIEDFMPDRLTVALTHAGPGLLAERPGQQREAFTDAGAVTLRAQADYLFGKPASGRTLKVWARIDPATWHPSGSQWLGWTFNDSADGVSVLDRGAVSGTRSDPPTVVADAKGAGSWDFDLAKLCADQAKGRARPWRLLSGGEVQEVGGRAVSANAPPLLLHPVRTWLGGRLVESAGTTALELRVVSPSGEPTPGNATVRLHREQWTSVIEREHGITRYRSTRELIPVGDAAVVAVTADSGRWVLPADLPAGTYALCAEWQATRQMISIAHRPGAPGGWQESLSRERPDRCEVSVRKAPALPVGDALPAPAVVDPTAPLVVGDEALVTIRSPFPGRALLTVCTDRVVEARVVELTGNGLELRLPVTAAWRPDAFVCVAVIRRVEASAQLRLHRAWGVVRARTDESSRHLAVELTTPAEHVPGIPMPVTGVVRSADGAAAPGATVTLAVVDEGILRLTAYRTPDPFAWFIRPRALGVAAWDAYADLLPELPRVGGDSPTGGDGGAPRALALGRYQSPVSAKRVVPFAWWSGLLTSDAEGRVSVQVPVPANFNGRLRVMAVVAGGAQAGMAEGWTTARGPVVLQTSWPRFAAPGDRFQVSATVMNLSGAPGRLLTRVVLPVDGLLRAAVIEQQQALADGAEARVVFDLTAAAQSGVAQAHVIAELSRDGVASPLMVDDAVELPVRPGSPRITVGGEATVTAAAPWRGEVPGNFMPGSGTVELRLAPRPSLALPRGLDYLYRYPHGCAEQTTSACFPLVHLRDLGDQLAPDLFLPAGITRRLNDGINRLQLMEVDGGLSMWAGGDYWSWASVYATHFLVEARRAGHAVPEDFLRRMLAGCRRLDARNEWKWAETQAYSCYVLALAGQPAHALMQRLEDLLKIPTSESEIGPATRCWLSAAWLESGRKDLATALVPQRLPTLRKDRHLDGDLASPIRDRAVLLATLIDVMPEHPGIPGLAQELASLAPWPSTQDTSFALLALGRYLRHAKQTPPPIAVRLLVDGAMVGTADPATPGKGPSLRWSGNTAKTIEASIDGEPQARSWISWLATGVPLTPPADATNGLTVERRWFDEHGKDLTGKPLTSGDLVRVELTVTSAIAYRGVVMEDLLPAGLEIENPRLLGNAAGRPLPVPNQSQRSEVRDDRLITMGDLVRTEQGKWVLTGGYLARAVTPGTYVLPPLRAECMYDIAVNGIAGAGTVTVVPAK